MLAPTGTRRQEPKAEADWPARLPALSAGFEAEGHTVASSQCPDVKIAATGVCHTDLHAAEGDWPVKPEPPFIPGHEGVGHVVAIGSGVTNVKEGDRLGVPWLYTACGHCKHCLGGWETLC